MSKSGPEYSPWNVYGHAEQAFPLPITRYLNKIDINKPSIIDKMKKYRDVQDIWEVGPLVSDNQIRADLVELNFIGENDRVESDESLFDRGLIDSLGIMSVVSLLAERYGVDVPEEDLLPDNFDSISSIARYVSGKLGRTNRNRV